MSQEHRTEAACLLEQGALYRKRIGLAPLSNSAGDPIFAGLKHAAFSLYFGDAPIYHFDLEGRWQRAFVDGIHYLKGLDATIQAIDRVREGASLVLHRRSLDDVEAGEFDSRVRTVALELAADLHAGRLDRREPPAHKAQPLGSDDLLAFLDRIERWDAAAWRTQRERYRATYGPIPFLPPESQHAVVLQATLGNAEGRSFGLAPAFEHHVRTQSEFARHAEEVSDLLGRRLLQSRLIFLSGSDVLQRPVEDIAAYLETIGRIYPIQPVSCRDAVDERDTSDAFPRLDGIHAFLADFTIPPPNRSEWAELVERGLIRVSLGVESGDREVRAIYRKSWDDGDLRDAVADLKRAGLGVSILTLVGAGGIERAEPHVLATARLIESLDLGPGDFVFLLDENEVHDPTRRPEGLTFLRGSAWTEQQNQLKRALAHLKCRGIKVLPYTLEKQWACR